ncbi:MAG: hypothetical protein ACK5D5_13850 [Bacteroidota bacterium]
MKTKQIILYIGLFTVLIFSSGGYIGVKIIQKSIRSELKKKIKYGLKEEELITFSLNKAEFENLKWVNDDEFFYRGNLYDLISEQSTEYTKTLKVISDKTEENLFKNLDQLMNDEISKSIGKEPLKVVFHFITKKFIQTNNDRLNIKFYTKSGIYPLSNIELKETYIYISTPPPKI